MHNYGDFFQIRRRGEGWRGNGGSGRGIRREQRGEAKMTMRGEGARTKKRREKREEKGGKEGKAVRRRKTLRGGREERGDGEGIRVKCENI